MTGTYYITDHQYTQVRTRNVSTRTMEVEIPLWMFDLIGKARACFTMGGSQGVSIQTAITGILQSIPMDGEV
jgi:hypothetical protein